MTGDSLLRDLLIGVRRIRHERLVSTTVILTIAVAIAACTTIFTVVVNGRWIGPAERERMLEALVSR